MKFDAFIKSLSGAAHSSRERWKKTERSGSSLAGIEDFYDHVPCGCHALNENGIFLEINDTELHWLGCHREQVIGKKKFTDFITATSIKLFEKEFLRLKERGWLKDLEFEMVGKSGAIRPVLLSATALYDENGRFLQCRSTLYDISERQDAEHHFGLLSQALNTLSESAFITDENALFCFVNEQACRALGYTREELLTMGVYDINAEFTLDHWPAHWAEVKARQSLNFETHHRTKDGRIYPVEINANLFEYKGKAYHFALVHDITERKQVQEQARQIQHFLRMQIARMPIGLIVWDKDFSIQAWNPAVASIFGFTEAEALGRHPYDLIVLPENQPVVEKVWRRLLKEDQTTHNENENITKDGRIITCYWTNTPLRTSNGETMGVMSMVQDITERKRTEELLHRLNRELRAISECNQVLMRAIDEPSLLKDICRIVCEDAEYCMAWVGYPEQDTAKTLRPVAWAGEEKGYLANAGLVWSDKDSERGPTGTAIRTGKTVFFQDLKAERTTAPWRKEALKRHFRCCISMPLKDDRGSVFGGFTIYSSQPNAFTPEEIRLLEELAENLAFGITVLRGRIERKRAEDEIRTLNAELERRVLERTHELKCRTQELETLFDTAPVGLAICHDVTGNHILGNPTLEEWAGVPRGGEVSLTAEVRPAYHTRDGNGKELSGSDLPMQRACRGEVISGEVLEIVRPDGKVYVVLSNARPILDEAGKPRGSIGAFMDITARKQAEEALRQSEERFKAIASNTPDLLLVQDRDLRYELIINPQLGFTEKDVIGKTDLDLLRPDEAEQITAIKRHVLETGRPLQLEIPVTSSSGTLHFFQGSFIPRFNSKGEVDGLIGYFRDTTDQKNANEKIRRLNEQLQHRATELEAANQELEAFSYSASHDLRAPLRTIDSYSHILLEDCATHLPEESQAHLREICRATERMGRLIDGMLTLSRITRAQLQRRHVNLSDMASEVIDELRKLEPNRRVDVRIDPQLHAQGDPQLLRILLDNLLGNAWKFSNRESVADIHFGQTKLNGEFIFFVRDNGVGFDMKYVHKLFGAFQRLHKASDFPGTGVGLATVLRVISRHSGRIWAESKLGEGATFYFTLGIQE